MKSIIKLVFLLIISIGLNSCKKNDVEKTVDIYVGGRDLSIDLNSPFYACYWKNGQKFPVSDGIKNAHVNSIFVSGGDVYLAGAEDIVPYGNRRAMYWKNNTRIYLPVDLNQHSEINSIFIVGNDVYVAGFETTKQGWGAKYWKNGVAVDLTNYTGFAKATSIVVNGADVYVAGFQSASGITVAKYWKNGVAINLSTGIRNAETTSMVVSGNDVYVAGKELGVNSKYIAKYWKNKTAVILSDGTNDVDAKSIALKGNEVYVAGSEQIGQKYNARLWINGLHKPLFVNNYIGTSALSVAVSGNDVYVVTTEEKNYTSFPGGPTYYETACWKNDKRILTNCGYGSLFLVAP